MPFLQFDAEIRRIVCTTNAIESVNARTRKAVRARGHFPNEQAALACVYLAVMAFVAHDDEGDPDGGRPLIGRHGVGDAPREVPTTQTARAGAAPAPARTAALRGPWTPT
ncbi:hypothetical protein GCM10023221_35060 [Luteimicrobium xylanilyticum]|uniref:Mutator family transposase n=1 Tax=Luteimicrobium xylanilyticum TaxID=1133546 RepID=A0A5P9Q6Y7_9MICO|nr:Transposase for insertion sequence element ISRM3 [Luteimicrobium xylanilyticum]